MYPWSVARGEADQKPTEKDLIELEESDNDVDHGQNEAVTEAFDILSKHAAMNIVKEKSRQKKCFDAKQSKGGRKQVNVGKLI